SRVRIVAVLAWIAACAAADAPEISASALRRFASAPARFPRSGIGCASTKAFSLVVRARRAARIGGLATGAGSGRTPACGHGTVRPGDPALRAQAVSAPVLRR